MVVVVVEEEERMKAGIQLSNIGSRSQALRRTVVGAEEWRLARWARPCVDGARVGPIRCARGDGAGN